MPSAPPWTREFLRLKLECDDSTLRRLILPKLGSRLANSVTSADIEAIRSVVGALHPYAANDILEIVRKMLNWEKVAGFVSKDVDSPVRGIVRFRERKRMFEYP
jgi:hypothetical protein